MKKNLEGSLTRRQLSLGGHPLNIVCSLLLTSFKKIFGHQKHLVHICTHLYKYLVLFHGDLFAPIGDVLLGVILRVVLGVVLRVVLGVVLGVVLVGVEQNIVF